MQIVCTPDEMELVYEAEDGVKFRQPVSDLGESGTLIDPDTGDDMPIVAVEIVNPSVRGGGE